MLVCLYLVALYMLVPINWCGYMLVCSHVSVHICRIAYMLLRLYVGVLISGDGYVRVCSHAIVHICWRAYMRMYL